MHQIEDEGTLSLQEDHQPWEGDAGVGDGLGKVEVEPCTRVVQSLLNPGVIFCLVSVVWFPKQLRTVMWNLSSKVEVCEYVPGG